VGELARRAGADKELETVRAQLEEMREKSRQRLGKRFELLLGQEHDYGYVDPELVERYVCLGDDVDPTMEPDNGQGRFADITKSAELYLSQQGLVWPMCVRDTPGVNDTFLVREQITVNAIRSSRVCVVVLSAHQALSTVDMALIRMIANIRARDVIIFVNRVDELGDPVREIPEIRDSIRETLQAQNGPANATILFGSAHWATHAIDGNWDDLGEASAQALVQMAEHEARGGLEDSNAVDVIWRLSGVPALGRAISERIIEGEGADMIAHASRAARNIANGLEASRALAAERVAGAEVRKIEREKLTAEIAGVMRDAEAELAAELDKFTAYLENRLDSSRRTFLQRATASLVKHLEENGESKVWTYDPTGLRVLLRSGYQVFSAKATRATGRSTRRPRPRWKACSWAHSSFRAGPSGWSRPGARHAAAGDAGPDHRARHQGQLVDPLVASPPQLRRLRRGILGHDRRRDRADDRGAQGGSCRRLPRHGAEGTPPLRRRSAHDADGDGRSGRRTTGRAARAHGAGHRNQGDRIDRGAGPSERAWCERKRKERVYDDV
jgi:hypothetical protein